MPRRDWNTNPAHAQKPRHKAMHSGARGKGHSSKRRAAKRSRDTRGQQRLAVKTYRRTHPDE